jgi:hypothetical protein
MKKRRKNEDALFFWYTLSRHCCTYNEHKYYTNGHLAKLIEMLGQFNQCSMLARCSENFLQLQN